MITIAIVEDDKKSAKILQDYILRYSEEKQEPLAVECFEWSWHRQKTAGIW